jgi:hypothetical protein
VLDYEDDALHLLLNGHGKATLEMFVGTFYPDIRDGLFVDGGVNPADINHGMSFSIVANGKGSIVKESDGTLAVPVDLNGQVELVIQAVDSVK